MNYYPFHVGDYAAHTAHLEPMEDLAYRRMLDLYYLREQALPADPAEVARLIRMRGNVAEVDAVLREFFALSDEGWRHSRCDAELVRMQDKQAKAKASAQASVSARQARQTSERAANVERTLNERSTDAELPTPTPTPTQIQEDPPASRAPPASAGRKPRALKRCPDDFDADPLRAWAAAEAPRADFGRELAKFRDHTFKTAHSDWPAAFRNWLRRASDDAAKRPQSFQDRKAAEAGKWMNPPSTRPEFDFIDMEAPDAAPLALR